MSTNLLTLNPRKTEFLVTGIKKQPSKIDFSFSTTHSAYNISFIFNKHHTSDQISSLSKSWYSTFYPSLPWF